MAFLPRAPCASHRALIRQPLGHARARSRRQEETSVCAELCGTREHISRMEMTPTACTPRTGPASL